jgi:hypothetical protein
VRQRKDGRKEKDNAEAQRKTKKTKGRGTESTEKRRPAFQKANPKKVGHRGEMQSQNRFAADERSPPAKRPSVAHGKDDSVFGARAADFEER